MNIETLKKKLIEEYDKLEAEMSNVPEKDVFVRLEIESWIDAISWILSLIEWEITSNE